VIGASAALAATLGGEPHGPSPTDTVLIQILEQVLNGLLAGAYYLLIALGLTLIFSLGGLVNLAHGAFYALGAYFAVKLPTRWASPACSCSRRCGRAHRLVVERFLFRRFYREDPALGLLLTFGLAMVAEQALRWIFGASPIPFSIPPAMQGPGLVGDFIYSTYRLLMLAVAVRAVAGLWCCCSARLRARGAGRRAEPRHGRRARHFARAVHGKRRGARGRACRAGRRAARADLGRAPAMGADILTASFVVVVIGGLGSFWGVVLAAVIVGVVRGLTVYFFPSAAEASMYLLMLLVLLFRPRGLFGERIQRFE
jgi:branched-chain amino acid transport system permease protein